MKRLLMLAGTALAIAAAATYWGVGLFGVRTPPEAPAVAMPEMRTIAATVSATGVVRLRVGAEVRVGSQVSGIVRKLNVTVGSRIRRDDVIAEIDSRALDARLAQSRAQVAVSAQDLRRAEVELGRARQLGDQQLVPRQQVEDLTLALDDAKVKLVKAQRDADVVETDRAYVLIRAPIAGTVASVSTQEGETVAAAFAAPTFVTIIDDRALQLVAMVDETDIGAVAVRNPVTFTVEAFPGRELTGRVERIAPKATIVSGVVNYEVTIAIATADAALRPDMTANISIRTAQRRALVVPTAAVQREGEERFVYVEQRGTLVKRAIVTGTRDSAFTEVTKGLATGERVRLGSDAPGARDTPGAQR